MFARFLPQGGDFFALFSRHAELMVRCSRELDALIADPARATPRNPFGWHYPPGWRRDIPPATT